MQSRKRFWPAGAPGPYIYWCVLPTTTKRMAGLLSFETRWGRDVGLLILGWLLASALAIVLLLTVVRGIFV